MAQNTVRSAGWLTSALLAGAIAGCSDQPSDTSAPTPSKATPTVLVTWNGTDALQEPTSEKFTVSEDRYTVHYTVDCTNSPDPVNDESIELGLMVRDPAGPAWETADIIQHGPVTTARPTGSVKMDGAGTYELLILTSCKSWRIRVTETGGSG